MRDKVLGLAHFLGPILPQKLASIATDVHGISYHRALTVIKLELKDDVLQALPSTGRILYTKSEEHDKLVQRFLDAEDCNLEKIMQVVEEHDAFDRRR